MIWIVIYHFYQKEQKLINAASLYAICMIKITEPNYHTTKWFLENLFAIEIKKIRAKMNKPVYLGLSILEISKTLMYETWYDYIKPKYQNNPKLCYMDTDSFIINIKTEDFYEDIANDVDKRFDT